MIADNTKEYENLQQPAIMFVSSRKKVLQAFGVNIVKMLALKSYGSPLGVLNLLTSTLIQ